jgi:quinol monooxygenase YgiN
MTSTAQNQVTLVNIFSVEPAKQQELVALLKQNTETVITSLKGWIATSMMASSDGTKVVIHSQWDSQADIDAMRADPRMHAYFPKIGALASFESTMGAAVMSHERRAKAA